MAEPSRVSVRIGRDGTVSAETHGMTGDDCLPYIALLEELLEAEAVDSGRKQEHGEGVTVTGQVQQRLEDRG